MGIKVYNLNFQDNLGYFVNQPNKMLDRDRFLFVFHVNMYVFFSLIYLISQWIKSYLVCIVVFLCNYHDIYGLENLIKKKFENKLDQYLSSSHFKNSQLVWH